MPQSCVVGGCTRNSTKNPDVCFLSFPKVESTRKSWIRFVNNTRSDFVLTDWSKVCSAHFADDCVDRSYKLKISLGISANFKLVDGAVPSIKAHSIAPSSTITSPTQSTSETTSTGKQSNQRRQSGGAFQQRETARILQDVQEQHQLATSVREQNTLEQLPTDPPMQLQTKETQTAGRRLVIEHVSQTNLYPSNVKRYFVRSRRCQTDPKKFSVRSKGIQAHHLGHSKRIQCQLIKAPKLQKLNAAAPLPLPDVTEDDVEVSDTDSTESDPTSDSYKPSSAMTSDSDFEISTDEEVDDNCDPIQAKKWLVFQSSLMELFATCPKCEGPSRKRLSRPHGGTMVQVVQSCKIRPCGYTRRWRSQPMVGNTPAGNILMSSAILMSGACIRKFLQALASINVGMISYATFFMIHQRRFLQPAIVHIWNEDQDSMMPLSTTVEPDKGVFLGMDMRADSMGLSAKFGCYSVMDLTQGKILHIELVQKNETSNKSNLMEKEGLVRAKTWLDLKEIKIETIVTDRHRQISKYIREELSPHGIKHYYDIWHVAKGLKKKLMAAARTSGCEVIREWIPGIVNNLYWVASSTPDGDADLMLAKFDSITNHILGIHVHENPLFPKCAHDTLEGRKWLNKGSKPAVKIEAILESRWLRKDVRMLSPSMQTSSVEAFHSVINQFAPKMFAYSYEGMLCRIYLAALYFNENINRKQATGKDGKPAFAIEYPRAKQDTGGYSVRKVRVACTHDFSKRIIERVLTLC